MDCRKAWSLSLLVVAGALALVGCGGTAGLGREDYQARRQLGLITEMYAEHLQVNGGPPKDEAAFRAFLDQYAKRRLKPYNVDNVDELLTSPRDGKPFVVVYGKRLAPKTAPNMPWAAYELEGVDGKRLAGQVRGGVEEYTPEDFAAQVGAE